jgi:hypothetical protein
MALACRHDRTNLEIAATVTLTTSCMENGSFFVEPVRREGKNFENTQDFENT